MNNEIKDAITLAQRVQKDLAALLKKAELIELETDISTLTAQEKADYGLLMQVMGLGHQLEGVMNFALNVEHKEGYLYKQANGRYCVDGNPFYELTSGRSVQYRDDETGVFYTSNIEHNGDDYYIVGMGRTTPIQNVYVCVKA